MDNDTHTISTEHLSLGINSRGLTFHSLAVRPDGRDTPASDTRDALVGFEDQEDYRQRLFFGSTVGRYANRLPAGKTALKTGAEISLSGPDSVCLHGGDSGFDTLPWTPINRPDSSLFPLDDPEHPLPPLPSDPKVPVSEANALFRLYSPAGNDGFPCTLETEALVVVEAPKDGDDSLGLVKIVLRSQIKEDGDKDIELGTPVNLTVHWGFRLDDCLEPDILGHSLYIDSTELVALDDKGLATGSIDKIPQDGTGLDFYSSGLDAKEHRKIGASYPDGGIDRNFLLTPRQTSPPTPISHVPQLVLTAPAPTSSSSSSSPTDTRLQLSFKSSLGSVQIYSAPGLDGSGPAKKSAHERAREDGQGREGDAKNRGYDRDGALFIEFQQPVGTVSHTCATTAEPGNALQQWLERRTDALGYGDTAQEGGAMSWERDSVVRKGQVWESWVEVQVKAV
ncbi:hypothetical protein JCM11491_000828 [Sporobolomyces phaffii]